MAKMLCEIAMCGAALPDGTGSKGGLMLCKNCQHARYYWRKRGGAALVARAERLQLYEERLAYLAPIIARNIKQVREQMAELHERVSRTAAAKLGEANAMALRARAQANARADAR
jgi:hypothetical protein